MSVVAPTFNSAQFLPHAVQSLLDQTIDQRLMEIIIVDDCSEDDTWKIITDFAARYSHVRAFRLERFSRGPGRARNVGVHHSEGEWIAFLDADDAYLPDGMEVLLRLAEHVPCDVASARLDFVYDGRQISPAIYDAVLPEALIGVSVNEHPESLWPPPTVCGRLFRAGYLAENRIMFPEEMIAEDSVFSTEALLRASSVSYSPEVVYEYLREGNRVHLSISDDLDPLYFSDWLETREMIETLYTKYSPHSYWELRYDTDLKHGMGQLWRFSHLLDLDDAEGRRTLLETTCRFQDFCAHYESADLSNAAPFQSLVPMLIGDGDLKEAVELIRLWNAAQRVTNGPTNSGGGRVSDLSDHTIV